MLKADELFIPETATVLDTMKRLDETGQRILFLAPCRSLPLLSLLCGVELPLVKLFNGELDREDRIAEASVALAPIYCGDGGRFRLDEPPLLQL